MQRYPGMEAPLLLFSHREWLWTGSRGAGGALEWLPETEARGN